METCCIAEDYWNKVSLRICRGILAVEIIDICKVSFVSRAQGATESLTICKQVLDPIIGVYREYNEGISSVTGERILNR